MTDSDFVDVSFDKANKKISYRTGLTVYEEGFSEGRLVGLGWNAAGYMSSIVSAPEPSFLEFREFSEPQAFMLEVDGQGLSSHWAWKDVSTERGDDGMHVAVYLEHTVRPIAVAVHSCLDGTSIIKRWLEITNTGQATSAISLVRPWSGGLQCTKRWRNHLRPGADLYSIGYMENTHWGDEGHFQWHPLPNAQLSIGGRYSRDRFRHPMFILRNEATGEHFIGQLAWSGGYLFTFDLNLDIGETRDMKAYLSFSAGPDGPAPLRVMSPSETVSTPAVHMGMQFGDLDDSVNAMHEHVRESVRGFAPDRARIGLVESGIGPERTMDQDSIRHQIAFAAEAGAEVFFIDAGWYVPPSSESEWHKRVGDWTANEARFPDGLGPIRDLVHENSMLFGLWMEPERLGSASLAREHHPDWIATGYDGKPLDGDTGPIDLAKDEVFRWVRDEIARVIDEYQLDFFRLDYNVRNLLAGGCSTVDGFVENNYWRYYDNFEALFGDLRKRFPKVIFETCASGGGRTDLGAVRLFTHTWVTDWQIAPRSFRITNGMTMALPPELIDRLVAGQNGHTTSELSFQLRQTLFGRPTLGMFSPPGAERNPFQMQLIKHTVEIYKDFVRPFIGTSRIHHHTPELSGFEPRGWGALELAAHDKTRAVIGAFRLSDAPNECERVIRPRGIDASKRYEISWDNSGSTYHIDGSVLAQQGLLIRLGGALTSELVLLRAL